VYILETYVLSKLYFVAASWHMSLSPLKSVLKMLEVGCYFVAATSHMSLITLQSVLKMLEVSCFL